jgi:hypothetical protein
MVTKRRKLREEGAPQLDGGEGKDGIKKSGPHFCDKQEKEKFLD